MNGGNRKQIEDNGQQIREIDKDESEREMEKDGERAREQEVIQEETDGQKELRGSGGSVEGHRVRRRQLLTCHLGSAFGVSRTESPGQRGCCIILLLARLVL